MASGNAEAGSEEHGPDRGPGLISAYGATDPAELFAVVFEVFFERPTELRLRHAALYEQMRRVYRTDSADWA